jgi:hypothetical protein
VRGYVEQAGNPEALRSATNDLVLDYLRELSARDEVVEALWEAVAPLGDVQSYSPDLSKYRYVAVATCGVIFGFAAGMSRIGFRLSPELKARALATGATDCQEAGSGWLAITLFRADWPEPDLRFWAREAYVHAREPAVDPREDGA